MAEKGFGVKEINLIGASGTPTIESPNNLNLNAVNVAISTNVSIGGTLTVSGNISIGGTLTYEDVTNIDSVGLVTAREGIFIPDNKEIKIGNTASSPDLKIYHNTSNSLIEDTGTGELNLKGNSAIRTLSSQFYVNKTDGSAAMIAAVGDGAVTLYNAGSAKLATSSSGVTVTGTLAATAVTGDGSALTGIAVTEAPVADYTITANGSSAYRFHGGGVDETADNPDLYLERGKKYRFNNTTGSSHPFRFRVSSGGSTYSTGVTGSENGVQFFTVPYDAPPSIVYQCTIHGSMVGTIYIGGGQYQTRSNNLCLQYTPSGSINKTSGTIVYATEVFDVGDSNAYNNSTGEFTAPVTGVYRIQYEHFASGAGRATCAIEKDTGSGYSQVKRGMRVYSVSAGSNWASVPTIFYLQLNATDKFRIVHNEGTVHLNTPWNHLTVQLVQ